jgi:hypothetical protein
VVFYRFFNEADSFILRQAFEGRLQSSKYVLRGGVGMFRSYLLGAYFFYFLGAHTSWALMLYALRY